MSVIASASKSNTVNASGLTINHKYMLICFKIGGNHSLTVTNCTYTLLESLVVDGLTSSGAYVDSYEVYPTSANISITIPNSMISYGSGAWVLIG